jgi:hypothetical protein
VSLQAFWMASASDPPFSLLRLFAGIFAPDSKRLEK